MKRKTIYVTSDSPVLKLIEKMEKRKIELQEKLDKKVEEMKRKQ